MDPTPKDVLTRLDKLSGQMEELRDGFKQAVAIADLDPDMALTRARKVLEFVVRDVFQRHTGEEAGTRPLENLLQRLVKDGHLPKRVSAYANAVRELGNVGTHAYGEAITKADVAQSLAQLTVILEWYFEHERPPGERAAAPAETRNGGSPPAVAGPGTSAAPTKPPRRTDVHFRRPDCLDPLRFAGPVGVAAASGAGVAVSSIRPRRRLAGVGVPGRLQVPCRVGRREHGHAGAGVPGNPGRVQGLH